MVEDGSRCTPDINTFNIILCGISRSSQVQDPEHLSHLILELMYYYNVMPNEQSYQHQFQTYVKTNNMLSISKLLLVHRETKFNGLDISVFNRILAESPVISEFLDYPMIKHPSALIRFMLLQSMPKHQMVLTMDSYQILKRLTASYPAWELDDLFKRMPVQGCSPKKKFVRTRCPGNIVISPTLEIGTVYRLIKRLSQQDIPIKWAVGYANYIRVTPAELIGIGGRPVTPDVTLDLAKRDWDIIMSCWRKQLHQYDNVTTDPFLDPHQAAIVTDLAKDRDSRLVSKAHQRGEGIIQSIPFGSESYF